MKKHTLLAAVLLLALTLTACGEGTNASQEETTATAVSQNTLTEEEKRVALQTAFSDQGLTLTDYFSQEKSLGEDGIFSSMLYINATVSEPSSAEDQKALAPIVQEIFQDGEKYAVSLTILDGNGKYWSVSGEAKSFPSAQAGTSASSSSQKAAESVNTNRHDDILAAWCAEDIVKQFLKAPSTAEVCPMEDMQISHLGNGEYMVTGWVDTENSYGAMLRSDFVVTYTATKDGYENGYAIIR